MCGTTLLRFTRGPSGRPGASCPACGSLERHRLLALFLHDATDLLARPQRVLHWAPERGLAGRLRAVHGSGYEAADLDPDGPGVAALDLQDVNRPDASYDAIICLHVLEHVPDDRAALREMRRLLAPGGMAVLQVPMLRDVTDEDPSVTDPEDRLRRFGQRDHVRVYGVDFVGRVEAAGLAAEIAHPVRALTPSARRRFGVVPKGFADRLDVLSFVLALHRAAAPRASA